MDGLYLLAEPLPNPYKINVQVEGEMIRVRAAAFKEVLKGSAALPQLLMRYAKESEGHPAIVPLLWSKCTGKPFRLPGEVSAPAGQSLTIVDGGRGASTHEKSPLPVTL